jgi:hypothetical protein
MIFFIVRNMKVSNYDGDDNKDDTDDTDVVVVIIIIQLYFDLN